MIDRQKLKPKSLAVSIAITVFATFVGLSASAQRVLLDRVIALVDEGVILQSELDIRINDLQQKIKIPELAKMHATVVVCLSY